MTKTETLPSKPRAARWLTLLRITIGLAFALLLLAAITYYRWTRAPLPQLDGEVKLTGIHEPATIVRDMWGVPHIAAATIEDAIFAQGYAIAQDRLWQMDLLRRAANGELSAVLGPGENNSQLDLDKQQRAIGLRRIAARSLPLLSDEARRLLDAYSRGVNAYIETHRDRLPFEFHLLGYQPGPWQPLDTLAIGKLMALSLSSTWKRDLMRAELAQSLDPLVYKMLFDGRTQFDRPIVGEDLPAGEKPEANVPTLPPIAPEIFAAARAQSEGASELFLDTNVAMLGSNNWVISGSRTETGKPLLASDPHQGLTLPAIWHQVHLRVSDGSYHAAGVALIGVPGVVIGHNEHIAWGETNLMADVQDLYIEEFDPNNPKRYRVGDEWRDAEVIKEPIAVRTSMLSSATTTVEHEIIITRHGPIVATAQGQKLALRWTGLDADLGFSSLLQLNRARNWEEFCAALRIYPGPMTNFVYADVDGNIGYYGAGRVPIRSSGDGSLPYNGRWNEGEWVSFIPFEELPHLYNPPGGFIETANQRVTGGSYPYQIANDWGPPYRAYRIDNILSGKERFKIEEMHQLQGDVYSVPAHLFAEQALKMAGRHPDDGRWRELQAELTGWDGKLLPESRAAAVASMLRNEFTEKFLNYWLGQSRPIYDWYLRSLVIDRAITERPAAWLPKPYEDYEAMVLDCYQIAIGKLIDKLGADRGRWRYGAINRLVFAHPLAKPSLLKWLLNAPTLEPGGSANTVNAINTTSERVWGPSMRMVVSLADFDATTQSIVPGESGQFASEHYTDQLPDWLGLHPHPFPFSEGALQPLVAHRLTLAPAR